MLKWFKSRTINWAAVIAALGVLEMQFQTIRTFIPEKYQGLTYIAVAGLMAYLRVTHKPL